MPLEMREICERCEAPLPRDSESARICSYECTFCADCVETKLGNVCPNCGGGFAPRPIRPAKPWRPGVCAEAQPPSGKRMHLSFGHDDVAAFTARVREIPPEQR